MKDNEHSATHETLPLPTPTSPRVLDDKILAYARQHTPTKASYWQPRWATGLAAASITAMAVFIGLPQQTAINGAQESDLTLIESAMMADQMPVQSKPPNSVANARATMSKERPARIEHYSVSDEAMEMEVETEHADTTVIERLVPATAIKQRQLAGAASQENNSGPAALALAASPIVLDEPELRIILGRQAQRLTNGETAQADAEYQALRDNCPACELPETLLQALKKYGLVAVQETAQ